MKKGRSSIKILTGKTGKRSVWEDNIRMDLKEIAGNTNNCVDLAQDKNYWIDLVNAALNLQASRP
jgi:hypothetical protein